MTIHQPPGQPLKTVDALVERGLVAHARRDVAQLLWLLFGSAGAGAPPPRVPWRASPGST